MNYPVTDTQQLTLDVSWTQTGCSATDYFYDFQLFDSVGSYELYDCPVTAPISIGAGQTSTTVTCNVAAGAIQPNNAAQGRYYVIGYSLDPELSGFEIPYYPTISFTHDPVPTQAITRRRRQRELAGLQVPYGVQCATGETPCHLGGERWECIDTSSNLESCGACPLLGGINCIDLLPQDQDANSTTISCIAGKCLAFADSDVFSDEPTRTTILLS